MLFTDSRNQPKAITTRLVSRPLKDLCVNISEPVLVKQSFINSPTAQSQIKKALLMPKPMTAPSTPRSTLPESCRTPRAITSKIKSPSNYIFETHSHSNKFASTPKKPTSQKSLIPAQNLLKLSEKTSKLITKTTQPEGVNKQKEHLFTTFQAIKLARALREPSHEEILAKTVKLSRRKGYEKKKTVVFDLDETLVHCVNNNAGHVEIEIDFPVGAKSKIAINIRPYAREVLSAASKDFEVIIFTASHQCYADKVIDYLDPEKQWVHHRLYRNHCIPIDGIYVKDLRILADRNIKDIIIVDNAAYSFAFQITSGIPIVSWYVDMADRELQKLVEYLKVLARVEDIRVINQFTFHLDTFYEDYIRDFIARAGKENEVCKQG